MGENIHYSVLGLLLATIAISASVSIFSLSKGSGTINLTSC